MFPRHHPGIVRIHKRGPETSMLQLHLLSLDEACAWLMEIIGKGYNRWGNRRSRTTYVILCDEPWKKQTDTSGHDKAPCFLSLPVSFLLGLGSDTSFDTTLLFLAWTPVLRLIQTELAHSTILTETGWTIVAMCSLGTWNCVHKTVKCVLLLRVCMF